MGKAGGTEPGPREAGYPQENRTLLIRPESGVWQEGAGGVTRLVIVILGQVRDFLSLLAVKLREDLIELSLIEH